jgi:hypothetical protein
MSDLQIDIVEMLGQGTHPATISAVLEVPVTWVYEVSDSLKSKEVFSPFRTVNS